MEIVRISSQYYVVIRDGDSLTVVDGPYQERNHAEAMSRIREID